MTPWIVAAAHRPFYADSTDFTGERLGACVLIGQHTTVSSPGNDEHLLTGPGLPDPSKNFTIATSTLNETDGDQYIAQQQRANLEPLFAQYNVSAPAALRPLNNTVSCEVALTQLLHVQVDLFYNGHKHMCGYFGCLALRFACDRAQS